MTIYCFKLITYDPAKPWVIESTGRDSVELPDQEDFATWAHERYPSNRYRVELEREPFRWITSVRQDQG